MVVAMGNPGYSQQNMKELNKGNVSSPCLHSSGLGSVYIQVAKVSWPLKKQEQGVLVNLVVVKRFRPSNRKCGKCRELGTCLPCAGLEGSSAVVACVYLNSFTWVGGQRRRLN